MSPETPKYRAGLGAWVRALKLKPSLVSPLSEMPRESPWQRREAGQLMGLMLNSLLVEVSVDGINTEEAWE